MRPQEITRESIAFVKRGFYTIGGLKVPVDRCSKPRLVLGAQEMKSQAPRKCGRKPVNTIASITPSEKRSAEIIVVGMDSFDAAEVEHHLSVDSEVTIHRPSFSSQGHRESQHQKGSQSVPSSRTAFLAPNSDQAKGNLRPRDTQPRVMVLDFASDTVPGGGARGNQVGTQEESLCRRSSLLVDLESLPYPIPHSGCAVCPDVVVFRANEDTGYDLFDPRKGRTPFHVMVLASAMPSMEGVGDEEEIAVRSSKIDSVLREFVSASAHSKVRSLVLGAWGCGAFGNDAKKMASVFRHRIEHWFTVGPTASAVVVADADQGSTEQPLRIVFAVRGKKNLAAFCEAFSLQ